MKHDLSSSMLRVTLGPGETVVAEAGAMVARSPDVRMDVLLHPGRGAGALARLRALLLALTRRLVGGASFLVNRFSAPAGGGWVWLAPALRGEIQRVSLGGEAMLLTAGAYLASAGDVDLRVRWGGLRAILARRGAFLVEVSGVGDLWISSYGALDEIDCDGSYWVDAGHVVGFDASLGYRVRGAGGGAGFAAPGEGLSCEFTGRGRILVRARSMDDLVNWLTPLLPP